VPTAPLPWPAVPGAAGPGRAAARGGPGGHLPAPGCWSTAMGWGSRRRQDDLRTVDPKLDAGREPGPLAAQPAGASLDLDRLRELRGVQPKHAVDKQRPELPGLLKPHPDEPGIAAADDIAEPGAALEGRPVEPGDGERGAVVGVVQCRSKDLLQERRVIGTPRASSSPVSPSCLSAAARALGLAWARACRDCREADATAAVLATCGPVDVGGAVAHPLCGRGTRVSLIVQDQLGRGVAANSPFAAAPPSSASHSCSCDQ
jgi:hypothetical protein